MPRTHHYLHQNLEENNLFKLPSHTQTVRNYFSSQKKKKRKKDTSLEYNKRVIFLEVPFSLLFIGLPLNFASWEFFPCLCKVFSYIKHRKRRKKKCLRIFRSIFFKGGQQIIG